MKLHVARLGLFDRSIELVSNVDIGAAQLFPTGGTPDLELHLLHGERESAQLSPDAKRLIFSSPRPTRHMLRQLAALLLDLSSPDYAAVHASGFRSAGRCILCCGPSGSGKSSVAALFPDAELLDDDLLVVDRERMYPIGRPESPHPAGRTIDLALLLDSSARGDSAIPLPRELPRSNSVLDALPAALRERQSALSPVALPCPTYAVGTGGELDALARWLLPWIGTCAGGRD